MGISTRSFSRTQIHLNILGHVELSTTEIYARASTEAKRKALESAYADIVTDDLPEWTQDLGLLDWLTSL